MNSPSSIYFLLLSIWFNRWPNYLPRIHSDSSTCTMATCTIYSRHHLLVHLHLLLSSDELQCKNSFRLLSFSLFSLPLSPNDLYLDAIMIKLVKLVVQRWNWNMHLWVKEFSFSLSKHLRICKTSAAKCKWKRHRVCQAVSQRGFSIASDDTAG